MGGRAVKITADTHILVRTVVDDVVVEQAAVARTLLSQATTIAVPVPVFCELAWVLKRAYSRDVSDVATAIQAIIEIDGVATDVPAVEAGLAALRAGADFADGVIARQGKALGGTVFASFDRQALARLPDTGATAADPSDLIA